ncbi:efflux RND transporter periplasmic adaptor subunit [Maioricimonas rarisocia]|nr:HlyD family efflux transporter periplasmic adaptor subunit [Maioricimonas rarisocia]
MTASSAIRPQSLPGRTFLAVILLTWTAAPAFASDSPIYEVVCERCQLKLIDRVTLTGRASGVIVSLPREGDPVKEGAIVVQLDDRLPRLQRDLAEKEVANDVDLRYSEKSRDVASLELRKALLAREKEEYAFSDMEVQRLQLAAQRAELAVEQVLHDLDVKKLQAELAEVSLDHYRVPSPIDGVVSQRLKSVGESVVEGEAIVEIINTDTLRVDGYVSVEHAWRIRRGGAVTLQLEIPDVDLPVEQETFAGKIVFVDSEVDPVTSKIHIWAEIENRDGLLRAGLHGRMTVTLDKPQP